MSERTFIALALVAMFATVAPFAAMLAVVVGVASPVVFAPSLAAMACGALMFCAVEFCA